MHSRQERAYQGGNTCRLAKWFGTAHRIRNCYQHKNALQLRVLLRIVLIITKSSTSSYTKLTSLDKLKVTLLSWDGDKDQPPFADWLDGYSDLIRSLGDGGDQLELFLDAKLGRRINVRSDQPSFLLEDDDFKEAFAAFQGQKQAAQVNAGNATEATSTGDTGGSDDDSVHEGKPVSDRNQDPREARMPLNQGRTFRPYRKPARLIREGTETGDRQLRD